jgi:hypothetical protein
MPAVQNPTKPLGKVNIPKEGKQKDGSHKVEVCFQPSPELIMNHYARGGEGMSAAFLGLDASFSMTTMYGRGGTIFMPIPNYVQAVARKLGAVLCDVSKTGKTGACYWAVNFPGDRTEWIGEYDEAGWEKAEILGPKKEKWGKETKLLPVLKIAVEQIHKGKNADFTMAVFITDGIWDDHDDVKAYCRQLGQAIVDGKVPMIKMILIGVGSEVDEDKLRELDDLFEGTPLEGKVDLWATGLVSDLKEESDIIDLLYSELMSEIVIAPTGHVESGSGRELATDPKATDGMMGVFSFMLPKGETIFRIHVGGQVIEQDCSEVLARV